MARSTESASMDNSEQQPAQPIARPTAPSQWPTIAGRSAIIRASLPRLRPNTNPLAESRDIRLADKARSTESASMDNSEQQPAQPIARPTAPSQLPTSAVRSAMIRASLPRLRPNTNPLAESRDIRPADKAQSN